jgi:uncharacterized protein involved in exopolysaccharide biosynthesis
MILLSFLVVGLAIGWLIWYLVPQLWPEYTAETFIRVLPGTEKTSTVNLLRHKNTLESLIDRDKIQQTEWFQGLGKNKDERLKAGVSDLKRRFRAKAIKDGDLIRISMTCRDGKDADTLLNEMADTFLKTQQSAKRKQISSNLMFLEDNQVRLQRELDLAERSLDDVRRRYGFADLEQHDYPHPITERLIRLQSEEDECAVEIEQLKTQSQTSSSGKVEPNSGATDKDSQLRLTLLQGRLEGLRKMRAVAEKQQEELDLARSQYAQRKAIRDERRRALDSVTSRIEETKILYDNPDAGGVQLVEYSAIPRKANIPRWKMVIPTSGAAGFLLGIVCVLLVRPGGKKSASTNTT